MFVGLDQAASLAPTPLLHSIVPLASKNFGRVWICFQKFFPQLAKALEENSFKPFSPSQ